MVPLLEPSAGGAPQVRHGRFIYDVETDGFLDILTTIHSLVMRDLDTGAVTSVANDGSRPARHRMEEAVRKLNNAEFRAGHNIIKFDEPAIAKVYPDIFEPNPQGCILDTLIAARLIWPNVAEKDKYKVARGQLEGRLTGSQSLEAWGQRLNEWKGDYAKERAAEYKKRCADLGIAETKEDQAVFVWGTWNHSMQSYCEQDVEVNFKLFELIASKKYPDRAFRDEMAIAMLCQRIEVNGFPFNEKEAGKLVAELVGVRAEIEEELRGVYGAWIVPEPEKTPHANSASMGYWGETSFRYPDSTRLGPADLTESGSPTALAKRGGAKRYFEGYPYTPIKFVEFNPGSRFHIADRLKVLYGWEPTIFNKDGTPKLDEETLNGLEYPHAKILVDYFTVTKRLGQVSEGRQAWLQLVRDGKVHGSYNTVGAVTRRATHSNPNIGQVPGVKKDKAGNILLGKAGGWGYECRALFGAPNGWWQVGTDASGLELRCLGHFMARFDSGAYIEVLLKGDVHKVNQEAAGLPTRGDAKTFIYAFLYGAGGEEIGKIIKGGKLQGQRLKVKFLKKLPALKNLIDAVKSKAKALKYLNALDDGPLHIRSDHAALNTLLQSAGALICKRWGVVLEQKLLERGYKHGWSGDFVFLAWVHDEYQIACRTRELAEEVGALAQEAMKETEAYYGFRCPLDTEFKIGKTWAECH